MSDDTVKRLQDRRKTVWEQAKKIASTAAEENRNMSGEEDRQWNELTSEMDGLDSRVHDLLYGEMRAKESADKIAAIAGKPIEQRGGEGGGVVGLSSEQEAVELRKFLKGEIRSYELDS